jgi:tetratricopeptide (TPR) repeat protein
MLGLRGAMEHFESAISIFPNRAEAIFEVGNQHYLEHNFQGAEENLRLSISCDRKHRCIRYEGEKYFEAPCQILIEIYLRQKRFNDAEELLTGIMLYGNESLYDKEVFDNNMLYARFYNNAGLEFMKARTIEKTDTLIIQLPEGYDGLGDNLIFSHIPRLAKESGKFSKVLISNRNQYKGNNYPDLVWKLNPYVDGFTDLPGTYSSIKMNRILDKWSNIHDSLNLMDSIMLLHDLDDGKRGHKPECYYKPQNLPWLNDKTVFDPGAKTMKINAVNEDHLISIFNKNDMFPNYIIGSEISSNTMSISGAQELVPTSIFNWADIMYSAKHYICFNSGGYWLSGALGIKAKHLWVEKKNLTAWSFLDHQNIFINIE